MKVSICATKGVSRIPGKIRVHFLNELFLMRQVLLEIMDQRKWLLWTAFRQYPNSERLQVVSATEILDKLFSLPWYPPEASI